MATAKKKSRIIILLGVVPLFLALISVKADMNQQRAAQHARHSALVSYQSRINAQSAAMLRARADIYAMRKRPAHFNWGGHVVSQFLVPRQGGGTVEVDQIRLPEGLATVSIDGATATVLHQDLPPIPAEVISAAWVASQLAVISVAVCAVLTGAVAIVFGLAERKTRRTAGWVALAAGIALLTIVPLWCDAAGKPLARPYSVLPPLAIIAAGGALVSRESLRRKIPDGCCRSCGYDLTANVSGVCPECGRAIAAGIVTASSPGVV